jgi:hypothetical protein
MLSYPRSSVSEIFVLNGVCVLMMFVCIIVDVLNRSTVTGLPLIVIGFCSLGDPESKNGAVLSVLMLLDVLLLLDVPTPNGDSDVTVHVILLLTVSVVHESSVTHAPPV